MMDDWIKLVDAHGLSASTVIEKVVEAFDGGPIAGCVLLRDDGKEILVGHVNKNGGRCDCCAMYDHKFVAFKRVWLP